MAKLYKMTPLEDNFSCNFNVIMTANQGKSVKEILNEWVRFRVNCISRRVSFSLKKRESSFIFSRVFLNIA
jgi:DNA gyrase subunit A